MCEYSKCTLSFATYTTIEVNSLFEGIDFYASLTHAHFKNLCQDIFHGTLEPVETDLHNLKIDKANIDDILYVSCSTRIPHAHFMPDLLIVIHSIKSAIFSTYSFFN